MLHADFGAVSDRTIALSSLTHRCSRRMQRRAECWLNTILSPIVQVFKLKFEIIVITWLHYYGVDYLSFLFMEGDALWHVFATAELSQQSKIACDSLLVPLCTSLQVVLCVCWRHFLPISPILACTLVAPSLTDGVLVIIAIPHAACQSFVI